MRKSTTPPPPADHAARLAFLKATSRYWKPDPLPALLRIVAPVREWLQVDRCLPEFHTLNARLSFHAAHWLRLTGDASTEAQAVREGILSWKRDFPFPPDDWVEDAALATIAAYKLDLPSAGRWIYVPRKHPVPRFNLTGLYPDDDEDEASFRKRARSLFEKSLNQYCTGVKARCGERSTLADRDAQWTARRLQGDSWVSIAEEIQGKRYSDPEETVRAAVRSFCNRAGIALQVAECSGFCSKQGRKTGSKRDKASQNENAVTR